MANLGSTNSTEVEERKGGLMLPAPSEASTSAPSGPTSIQISGKSVPLDALGPMIVNSDGTLSRIANWGEMIESERERTLRVLVARNKVRLANQEQIQGGIGELGSSAADLDDSKVSILRDKTGGT